MKKIYRYSFDGARFITYDHIEKFLDVQIRDDLITVWAIVDLNADPQLWEIYTFGTGWPTSEFPGEYIGTVQERSTGYVWHVFAAQHSRSVDCGWENPEVAYVN